MEQITAIADQFFALPYISSFFQSNAMLRVAAQFLWHTAVPDLLRADFPGCFAADIKTDAEKGPAQANQGRQT